MRDPLRAGAAVYNAGHRHAAHDCWERHWLDLRDQLVEAGEEPPATVEDARPDDSLEVPSLAADERLLHGLIQFTAAVHHREDGNVEGARGLAEGTRVYLGPLPAEYRDCALGPLREWTAAVAEGGDEGDPPDGGDGPPPICHEGRAVGLSDLDLPAARVAAPVVAEATGFDPEPLAAGAEYAHEEVTAGGSSRFATLVLDFVAGRERGIVHQRLASLVDRRQRRDRDVDGLF